MTESGQRTGRMRRRTGAGGVQQNQLQRFRAMLGRRRIQYLLLIGDQYVRYVGLLGRLYQLLRIRARQQLYLGVRIDGRMVVRVFGGEFLQRERRRGGEMRYLRHRRTGEERIQE